MKNLKFVYQFDWANRDSQSYQLELDPKSISIINPIPDEVSDWINLDFHQCPNCPLDIQQSAHCPMAYHLIEVSRLFSELNSYEEVKLTVSSKERNIVKDTTAQRAISSLLGLIIPASGCPHTAFFRPMARFHLPLSSEDETIFRAASMYLMAQYFLNREKHSIDLELTGLSEIYQQLHTVNQYIAERIRHGFANDSAVNAVILLDIFAKAMPYAINDSLEEIRFLFQPYFENA